MSPERVHLVACTLAAGVLGIIGREQWFIRDDWAYLADRSLGAPSSWFPALVDHFIALPAVLFGLVRWSAGLDEYLPFLLLSIAAHVLAVHLLVRLALRSGARPVVAVLVGVVPLVSPIASEHVLFAVNVSFGLGFVLPLLAILIVDATPEDLDPEPPARGRIVASAALLVLATTSASVGLVLAVVAAVWVGARFSWRLGVVVGGPAVAVYAWWLAAWGATRNSPEIIGSAGESVRFAVGVISSASASATQLPPVFGAALLGTLAALGVAVLVGRGSPGGSTVRSLVLHLGPPGLLAAAGIGLLAILARQRGGDPGLADAPRYQHLLVLLLLPLVILGASRLVAAMGRAGPAVLAVAVLVTSTLSADDLVTEADRQAGIEQDFRARVMAVAAAGAWDRLVPTDSVDTGLAPDLEVRHLAIWVDSGVLHVDPSVVSPADELWAAFLAATDLQPIGTAISPARVHGIWEPELVQEVGGCLDFDHRATVILAVDDSIAIRVAPGDGADRVTLRIDVQDEATGVRTTGQWIRHLRSAKVLVVDRPGTLLLVHPGTTGRLRLCDAGRIGDGDTS